MLSIVVIHRRVILRKGAQATIYRKYLKFFEQFLIEGAKHDIDKDGTFWCKKEEWVAFLCPLISDDDANAIAHGYCGSNAKTAIEIIELIRRGKEYICHRIYNMGFIKNLERRKTGRNVSYFRYLKEGETKTPPIPTSIYIIEKIFRDIGDKDGNNFKLSLNKACDEFLSRLNIQKFPDDELKLNEWSRVTSILEKQGRISYEDGYCILSPRSTVD
jgi:hypothetical protein